MRFRTAAADRPPLPCQPPDLHRNSAYLANISAETAFSPPLLFSLQHLYLISAASRWPTPRRYPSLRLRSAPPSFRLGLKKRGDSFGRRLKTSASSTSSASLLELCCCLPRVPTTPSNVDYRLATLQHRFVVSPPIGLDDVRMCDVDEAERVRGSPRAVRYQPLLSLTLLARLLAREPSPFLPFPRLIADPLCLRSFSLGRARRGITRRSV